MGTMRKSRLSIYKQDRLIEYFVAGTTARTASSLCGLNRKTVAYFFHRLREVIFSSLNKKAWQCLRGRLKLMKAI